MTVHSRARGMRHAEIRQSDVAFSLNVESISGQASLFRVWEFGETTMTVAKATALCFMCLEFTRPEKSSYHLP